MKLSEAVLYRLAHWFPNPRGDRATINGSRAGSEEFERGYSRQQFEYRIRRGIDVVPTGMDVLEIGCGHGGIACFLAIAGSKRVTAIDINRENLVHAQTFADEMAAKFGAGSRLPIDFVEMDAYQLQFPLESFDLVVSDNSMEHFMKPEAVIQQAFRVLRKGGRLLIPSFSSIYSKHGLHLKEGLHVPWANLFFSEKTIIRVMQRLARENPELVPAYPGVFDDPQRVRDLRPYKDLNDITYPQFKRMAVAAGFRIEWFRPFSTRLGKIASRLPVIKETLLNDVLSAGAAASLIKP